MEDWREVFGAAWFWAAAALVWARAAGGVYGASRRMIRSARRDVAFARFTHQAVCWRLGPGQLWPTSIETLRWPVFGVLAVVLLVEGVRGHALALALATGLGPIAAASMALEPMVVRAAAAVGDHERDGLAAFAETLEQAWKARLAAVLFAVAATIVAALATRGGS